MELKASKKQLREKERRKTVIKSNYPGDAHATTKRVE